MNLLKFLISLVLFIFSALLFEPLTTAIHNATITGNTSSLIQVFPYIFVIVAAIFPIYYAVSGGKE